MLEDVSKEILRSRYNHLATDVRMDRVSEGFSGGAVWRVASADGQSALRCWPEQYPASRLAAMHHVLGWAARQGLSEVPVPFETTLGGTWTHHAGRLWELTPWQPGNADKSESVSRSRLKAAAELLGRWHAAMHARRREIARQLDSAGRDVLVEAYVNDRLAPSPGQLRRRSEWARFQGIVGEARDVDSSPLAARTLACARRLQGNMARWLNPVRRTPITVCLRDVHRQHVLFCGNQTTGLVDFGAMALDSPHCDLARLLGSFAPDRAEVWSLALEAYSRYSPYAASMDLDLVRSLDRAGTVIGALHWLEWLEIENRSFSVAHAAYQRWCELVDRIQRFV